MLWFGGYLLRFNSHLIGRKTINIPEIISGVHGFTGKTVNQVRGCYFRRVRFTDSQNIRECLSASNVKTGESCDIVLLIFNSDGTEQGRDFCIVLLQAFV